MTFKNAILHFYSWKSRDFTLKTLKCIKWLVRSAKMDDLQAIITVGRIYLILAANTNFVHFVSSYAEFVY